MVIPELFAQVNYRFTGLCCPTGAEVTMGVDNTAAGMTAQELGTAMGNAFVANLLPDLSQSITLSSVLVKLGPNDTGASAEVAYGNAGTAGATGEVPQCAILVQKITGSGGRAGRGRFFLPGAPESTFSAAGVMSGANQLNWADNLDAYQNEVEATTLSLALLHGPTSPINVPTLITSLAPQLRAGTQRRRNRR